MNSEQAKAALCNGVDVLLTLGFGQGVFKFSVVFVAEVSDIACFEPVASSLIKNADEHEWSLA